MRIPRAFIDKPLANGLELELDATTSHYLQKVLRLREGARITLFNGQGGEYPAVIKACQKRSALVQLGDGVDNNRESPLRIHLGIGLSRGERMDTVVQKATELGVTEISPLFTERCEVKLNDQRMLKRQDHWQKVITSACEQSGRNRIPRVHAPVKLEPFLANADASIKLLMHPADEPGTALPGSGVNSVLVLVGPEGGFSDQEVAQCTHRGFVTFCLGQRILRTETAPLAALSVLQYRWGDFG